MKGGKRPLGYTIIEVMIVLAISGVMFLIAATFINGKQQKASFTAGVNEMASTIQDTIEQVTDGQYSDIPLHCQPGTPLKFSSLVTLPQGSNEGCVFLGKFYYFLEGSSHANIYYVFTLAGNRLDQSTGAPATALNAIYPTAVDSGSFGNNVNLTNRNTTPQTLDVKDISVDGSNPPNDYAFGFIQSPGTINTTGNYNTGGQYVQLVGDSLLKSKPNLSESNVVSDISDASSSHLAYITSVAICMTDGISYATISIGLPPGGTKANATTNNNQLNVGVTMLGSKSC